MSSIIRIQNLTKVYQTGSIRVVALNGVSMEISEGEFVAIMGPSGSGKSTFMNLIGCLDVATCGSYVLNGLEITGLGEDQLAKVRNREIGFVFQSYNLIPKLTAQQNVEAPLIYRGVSKAERRERALSALKAVGLEDRAHHKPKELSGGQQQRVAIARALVTRPRVLLADEPTGNLDSKSGQEVMGLFQELNNSGNTIILVTHSEEIARHCKRIIRMIDGQIVDDYPVEEPIVVAPTGLATAFVGEGRG